MSEKRVVLVTLTEPFPYGASNGRWTHAFMKGLADRGYQIHCLAISTRPEWASRAREFLESPRVTLSFYPSSRVNGAGWLWRKWRTVREPLSYSLSDGLRQDLERELRRGYDVLHLDPLWAGYLAQGRERVLTSVHNLLSIDLRNVRVRGWRSLATKMLIRIAERRLLGRLRHLHATTVRLSDEVRRLGRGAAPPYVAPLALDASLYEFQAEDSTTEPVIGFLANMSWPPGHLAAERIITRIFPRIRTRRPDARLLLVGWTARKALARHLGVPGVEILEDVPDPLPYLRRLQVLAYPLPPVSGMMGKILEAMAYGVPIVTTTAGAEGYEIVDGVHAIVTDDDETFAERVVELLADADLRRSLRCHARRLVEESHSSAAAGAVMDRMYRAISE